MAATPSSPEASLCDFHASFTRRVGDRIDGAHASDAVRGRHEMQLLDAIGATGIAVGTARRRLGLDSGYLSRLLCKLERDGLVETTPDPTDRRRRTAVRTSAGADVLNDHQRRARQRSAELLAPLSERQRRELADALTAANRLLRAATLSFDVVDPRSDQAMTAMSAYFAELEVRFVDGFDSADTLVADAPAMRAPTGAFMIAVSDDEIVACGGIQRHDEATGEIKRMWVNPAWRGLGLGRRMLAQLEREIGSLGYTAVVLDTNDTLTEAIAMYERAGYRSIERYNDNPYAKHWFARDLD